MPSVTCGFIVAVEGQCFFLGDAGILPCVGFAWAQQEVTLNIASWCSVLQPFDIIETPPSGKFCALNAVPSLPAPSILPRYYFCSTASHASVVSCHSSGGGHPHQHQRHMSFSSSYSLVTPSTSSCSSPFPTPTGQSTIVTTPPRPKVQQQQQQLQQQVRESVPTLSTLSPKTAAAALGMGAGKGAVAGAAGGEFSSLHQIQRPPPPLPTISKATKRWNMMHARLTHWPKLTHSETNAPPRPAPLRATFFPSWRRRQPYRDWNHVSAAGTAAFHWQVVVPERHGKLFQHDPHVPQGQRQRQQRGRGR